MIDRLLGLDVSDAGTVRYLGRAWRDLTPPEAFAWRRSIGRVQSRGNWMETRSVMENLLLPLKHHTVVPENILRDSASLLARRFGLPGLPVHLPEACPASDLERAACVRAFLGRPTLVVLEHPMEFEDSSVFEPMIDAIQQVRRRKGAVVWLTRHESIVSDRSVPADRRYRISGGQLLDLEKPA